MNCKPRIAASSVVAWIALLAVGCASAGSREPEVTHDGLQRLRHSTMDRAYLDPEASFGQYQRVQLLDCFVAFRKNWRRETNRSSGTGLQGRVSSQDMEGIKSDLSQMFREVFTQELEKGGYPVVDEAGPDVLLLRPAIIDLQINAPDAMSGGSVTTFTTFAGSMTLFLELFDSETSDIIGRILDQKSAQNTGRITWSNSVTNRGEATRIMRRWASLLVTRLNQVRRPAEDGA